MVGIYSTGNTINITEVDGMTFKGRYAIDGSWNGVNKTGVASYVGLINPCGAINYSINNSLTPVTLYATNGSLNVTDSGVPNGSVSASITTLSLASAMLTDEDSGLAIDFTDSAFASSTGLYGSAYVKITASAISMLDGESQGLALDFTDSSQVSVGLDTLYGSAYVLS